MKLFAGAVALLVSVCAYQANAKQISIMSYNVENLFDTVHDAGTDDYTYLPKSVKDSNPEVKKVCNGIGDKNFREECFNLDWNEEILAKKIKNISQAIKIYSNVGPDILVLVEIENINAVNQLVDRGLGGVYKHRVLIEGDDNRGIDTAVVSKYPIVSSKHHSVVVNGKKMDTRGILEVTINVDGKTVTVFSNHWPSPRNPAEQRVEHAKLLSSLVDAKNSDLIVAAGDFNTLDEDRPHPFEILANDFYDSEQEAREAGVQMLPGTHNYKGDWSSLDRIFVSRKSRVLPDWTSFDILSDSNIMNKNNQPRRFNTESGEGYSDHLPIVIEVNL